MAPARGGSAPSAQADASTSRKSSTGTRALGARRRRGADDGGEPRARHARVPAAPDGAGDDLRDGGGAHPRRVELGDAEGAQPPAVERVDGAAEGEDARAAGGLEVAQAGDVAHAVVVEAVDVEEDDERAVAGGAVVGRRRRRSPPNRGGRRGRRPGGRARGRPGRATRGPPAPARRPRERGGGGGEGGRVLGLPVDGEPVELADDGEAAAGALLGALGEEARDEGVEAGEVGAVGGDGRGEGGHLVAQHLVHVAGVEGGPQREELVGDAAEGVEVGGGGELDAVLRLDLLGGHVRGRADQEGAARLAVEGRARDAKINEDGAACLLLEHHVGGLHVAVDDARGVDGGEAAGDLADDPEGLAGGEVRAAGDVLGHEAVEGAAVDELHGVVPGAAVLSERVDLHDVLVADRREGLGLADEALDEGRVGGELAGDHLEGHAAPEAEVAGLVHHAHRALAELALDAVAAVDELLRVDPGRHRTSGHGVARARERLDRVVVVHGSPSAYTNGSGQPGLEGGALFQWRPAIGSRAAAWRAASSATGASSAPSMTRAPPSTAPSGVKGTPKPSARSRRSSAT